QILFYIIADVIMITNHAKFNKLHWTHLDTLNQPKRIYFLVRIIVHFVEDIKMLYALLLILQQLQIQLHKLLSTYLTRATIWPGSPNYIRFRGFLVSPS